MYKIAICDDSRQDRRYLLNHIKRRAKDEIQIYEYASGEELLAAMKETVFEAVFLDVQMQGIDGNETAKRIRELDVSLVLAFCTGFVEPSPVTFEVQPYRYIMKNMTEEQVADYVGDVLDKMKENGAMPSLLANVGKRQVVIRAEHVIYIEKYKKFTRMHITAQARKRYGIYPERNGELPDIKLIEKLPVTFETLKKHGFGWPHDSYIINFQYICACTAKDFQLAEVDHMFAIARSKAKEFNEQKNRFMCAKYVGRGGRI